MIGADEIRDNLLARELGFHHADHMYDELTERQINDWRMIFVIEPFGEERADVRTALQQIATYKAGGVKKRLKVADYKPMFKNPFALPPTIEELKEKGRILAIKCGGTFTEAPKK